MIKEVIMTNVGAINSDRLHADCKVASTRFAGFSTRPKVDGIVLMFDAGVSDADILAVQAIVRAHDATTKTPAQQAREDLKAVAQSAVGVAYTDLTTNQLKALLAVLILESGGLANDLTIKPLGQWVR